MGKKNVGLCITSKNHTKPTLQSPNNKQLPDSSLYATLTRGISLGFKQCMLATWQNLNNNHSLRAILWSTLHRVSYFFLPALPSTNNWLTIIRYLEWHGATQWEWYVSTLQSKPSPNFFLFFPFSCLWFSFGIMCLSGPGCFEHNHVSPYMIQHYSFCPIFSPSN